MATSVAPLGSTAPAPDPTPAPEPAARPAGFARLPSLTGLRFIAAVMVFLFHASLTTEPPLNPFSGDVSDFFHAAASKTGWMGVTFFFLLSGFVLTYSARPNDTPRRFWRRRLVKLYPSHVAGWIGAMVLFAAATATWQQWLPNLLLLQTWIPDYHTYLSINPPSCRSPARSSSTSASRCCTGGSRRSGPSGCGRGPQAWSSRSPRSRPSATSCCPTAPCPTASRSPRSSTGPSTCCRRCAPSTSSSASSWRASS